MSKKTKANADITDPPDNDLDKFESMLVRITKAVTDSFNNCIEKVIGALDQKFTTKIEYQNTELFNVNTRVDALEKQITEYQKENLSLKDTIKVLVSRIDTLSTAQDDLDQYSRSDNLLVYGVPQPTDGSKEADVRQIVVDVLSQSMPNVGLKREHISIAHRTSSRRSTYPTALPSSASSSATVNRPPPIIVRFNQREVRNSILVNRRQLKGKMISVSEQLTNRRTLLLKKANELVTNHRVNSSWSHDGRILVKDKSNRIIVINSESDLCQL